MPQAYPTPSTRWPVHRKYFNRSHRLGGRRPRRRGPRFPASRGRPLTYALVMSHEIFGYASGRILAVKGRFGGAGPWRPAVRSMAPRSSPEQNPTLRGRRLAIELQRRREATGMSREEVARQREWSTSTIFRIETGRSRPQPGNVRILLELYGVTGPERDGLIQLTREACQPGWCHSFGDVLPNPYEVYIGLEAGAGSIATSSPASCPACCKPRITPARRSGTGR